MIQDENYVAYVKVNSHKIPFRRGIVEFALTPDFLDDYTNIISAHKRKCNKSAELNNFEICKTLKKMGIRELPSFLPKETLNIWNSLMDLDRYKLIRKNLYSQNNR